MRVVFTICVWIWALEAVAQDPVELISYNIHLNTPGDGEHAWLHRKADVAALIRFHRADIFCVQEALPDQMDDLETAFPDFSYEGIGRDDGKRAGESSAVFYFKERFKKLEGGTFWLSETPDQCSFGWDAACRRVCSWGRLEDIKSGEHAQGDANPDTQPADGERAWIRVNQVGYLPDDAKIAVLSSDDPLQGRFSVGPFGAEIGDDCGAWGPFRHNYRLDFTSLRETGRYRVQFGEVRSLPFAIGADAYGDVPGQLLSFMRLQRCGENPVAGHPCHQQDGIDTISGKRVDLVGGWHDAADRLKHMITTTYCVAALYLAGADDEADYGAGLVRKIHPDPETIYVQIADDRDHLPPATLWHDDRSDYGWGAGGPRAAWRATGKPEGPKHKNASSGLANLAGRAAAAMTLAGDLDTAKSLYRLAVKNPGCAMSVPVRAPYYYGESTCYDDLEWAAVELFIATGGQRFLDQAVAHARKAGASRWMGSDRHGHYEFFPYVNLAHWRLYPHAAESLKRELADYYRAGLEKVYQRALANPYRLGTPLVWCSTNDVIAAATQAVLYERMTGDARYRTCATEARDWIFGRNPWGVSMVVGVPVGGVYASRPHHMFHKIAGILPVGGLVDGPVYKDINDSLKFDSFGQDPYARFQSDVGVYHDSDADFSTNEPIIDGTVSLLLLLNLWP